MLVQEQSPLNHRPQIPKSLPENKKRPFDVLAKGRDSENSRGNKTSFELVIGPIERWKSDDWQLAKFLQLLIPVRFRFIFRDIFLDPQPVAILILSDAVLFLSRAPLEGGVPGDRLFLKEPS
jgi:hypothetical protein